MYAMQDSSAVPRKGNSALDVMFVVIAMLLAITLFAAILELPIVIGHICAIGFRPAVHVHWKEWVSETIRIPKIMAVLSLVGLVGLGLLTIVQRAPGALRVAKVGGAIVGAALVIAMLFAIGKTAYREEEKRAFTGSSPRDAAT